MSRFDKSLDDRLEDIVQETHRVLASDFDEVRRLVSKNPNLTWLDKALEDVEDAAYKVDSMGQGDSEWVNILDDPDEDYFDSSSIEDFYDEEALSVEFKGFLGAMALADCLYILSETMEVDDEDRADLIQRLCAHEQLERTFDELKPALYRYPFPAIQMWDSDDPEELIQIWRNDWQAFFGGNELVAFPFYEIVAIAAIMADSASVIATYTSDLSFLVTSWCEFDSESATARQQKFHEWRMQYFVDKLMQLKIVHGIDVADFHRSKDEESESPLATSNRSNDFDDRELEPLLEILTSRSQRAIESELDKAKELIEAQLGTPWRILGGFLDTLISHDNNIELSVRYQFLLNVMLMGDVLHILCNSIVADEEVLPDELEVAVELLQPSMHRMTTYVKDYLEFKDLKRGHDVGRLLNHWRKDTTPLGGGTEARHAQFRHVAFIGSLLETDKSLFQTYRQASQLIAHRICEVGGMNSREQAWRDQLDKELEEMESQLEQQLSKIPKRPKPPSDLFARFDREEPQTDLKSDSADCTDSPDSLEDALAELNKLIGLDSVKTEISKLGNFLKIRQQRLSQGLPIPDQALHFVFTGNPGTGKTTMARILARILSAYGILKTSNVVEAVRQTMVAGYIGQTAIKTNKVIDEAENGVLFIDEAYTLAPHTEGWDFGQEAIDTLLKKMEDLRDSLVVIVAGYPNEMKQFIESNPGLESRFTRYIDFPDYQVSELCQIYDGMCQEHHYILTPDAKGNLEVLFERAYSLRDENFGNGRFVRNVYEQTIVNQAHRLAGAETSLSGEDLQTIEAVDLPYDLVEGLDGPVDLAGDRSQDNSGILEAALSDLNNLIGLDSVKAEIAKLGNFLKIRHQRLARGMSMPDQTLHFVFTGNPGTGKTTVARILARILSAYGILKTSNMVEADRATMVAGYAGQTAIKTNKVIDEAEHGVLFIDEAYSLASRKQGDDFGREAIDTMLKKMEDLRDRLVVIVAGYPNEMKQFIESNPGLESRFTRFIEFPDYHVSDLCLIYSGMCREHDFILTPEASGNLEILFERAYSLRDENFGNGRFVRNVYEQTIANQAHRLARVESSLSEEELQTIEAVDLPFDLVEGLDGPVDVAGSHLPEDPRQKATKKKTSTKKKTTKKKTTKKKSTRKKTTNKKATKKKTSTKKK